MTPKKPDARGFTDEMLQNTEKYLETCVQPQVTMDSDSFRGLLARLQFAEQVAVTMEETARYSECTFCDSTESDDGELHFNHEENCELMADINAWKRSKGEDEGHG